MSLDIRKKISYELHKQARKHFRTRKTVLKGLNDLYQADIVDIASLSKFNSNYKYILTIIECFSKVGYAFPLKQKSATHVASVLSDFFKTHPMKNFQTDQGTEFYNQSVRDLTKKFNINHYSTFSNTKAAIVERFNRTIKSLLYRQFTIQGNYEWLGILPRIINQYNNTIHRTIGMKPVEVNRTNEKELISHLNVVSKTSILTKNKFNLGDRVRISKFRKTFRKGYLPNWTNELFTIIKVQPTFPVTYLLSDVHGEQIKGAFYNEELQKSKTDNVYFIDKVLQRKGKKILVRWSGFDKKHDSWITDSDII
jgi:transposase InsO family protein